MASIHKPDRNVAIIILPQNVGLAVTIKVASTFDMPGWTRIPAVREGRTCQAQPVHEPNRSFTIVILPEDVSFAIAVEVAAAYHMPGGAGIWPNRAIQNVGPIHKPDSRLTVDVLPEDVGVPIAVEITSTLNLPKLPRIPAVREGGTCYARPVMNQAMG